MNTQQRETLWQQLQQQGRVSGAMPQESNPAPPWFVRLMLGVAAWIGALFLFGFVGLAFQEVLTNPAGSALLGVSAIGVAVYLFRLKSNNDFALQLGLALCLAGQGLLIVALDKYLRDAAGTFVHYRPLLSAFIFLLELGLLIVPNFIHRLFSTCVAMLALGWGCAQLGWYFIVPPLLSCGLIAYYWHELPYVRRAGWVRPIGYGILFAMLILPYMITNLYINQGHSDVILLNAARINTSLLLLQIGWVIWQQMRQQHITPNSRAAWAVGLAALLLAVLAYWVPGLATGVLIVLLGFGSGNRVLQALGWCVLAWYVGRYYYSLETTLLTKSMVMALSGLVLLAARQGLQLAFPYKEKLHA
jgi:Domain of unknown function (DUF4401)